MEFSDAIRLLHPALAVTVVFPLLGIVIRLAVQTRERRLQTEAREKSKIPPVTGPEHVKVGRWLAGAVVGVALLGISHPIFSKMIKNQIWTQEGGTFRLVFVTLVLAATIASLVFLYQAQLKIWRIVFATLTSTGLIVLGSQPEVFRRGYEILVSHYYYGVTAAILMIISVTILPEIYRSKAWRRTHIFLNSIAVLLFIGQGMTGTRDLLEIPLGWQEPFIYQCDFENKTCPQAQSEAAEAVLTAIQAPQLEKKQ